MATKLDTLKHAVVELRQVLTETEAKRDSVRGAMDAAPINQIAKMSEIFAGHNATAEVLTKRLAQAQAAAEAEQKRLNSPEVKAAIKAGEKADAEFMKLCEDIGQQLHDLAANIDAAGTKGSEAAALLKQGEREPISANGMQFLTYVMQTLNALKQNGAGQFRQFIK